jgi:quercetin dioxygenase-like cupin family protein
MRRIFALTLTSLVLAAPHGISQTAAPAHVLLSPADFKWGAGPPALPPGMSQVALYGDPTQPGPFGVRVRVPAGYRVPPHWHPTAEHLTILSGEVAFGMGESFDESTMKTLTGEGYAVMPAEMRHYVKAKTASVFEVHALGPFVLTYVNPKDDPRAAPPAK